MSQRHILTVWNPVYGPRVMEMHLEVLLERARRHRQGEIADDDVYVWWGKVRSAHRRGGLPHLNDILAIDVELSRESPDVETHLYLTDYRSLYVAHVAEITADDMRGADPHQVPPYYHTSDLNCDVWFKLWDIRRLFSDDTVAVVHALAKLRNTRYHDQPVSLYGGMVDLPLIVSESEPTRYFDETWRTGEIGPDRYWVEFDAEHSGLGTMERDLRQNLLGDSTWEGLEPTARTFVATGEKIFRDHQADEGFDYGACVVEFCKGIESQCNAILARALAGAPPALRHVNVDGRSRDAMSNGRLGLRDIAKLLSGSEEMARWMADRFHEGAWFTGQFPFIIGQLAELRGEAAHSRRIRRDEAADWRNQLLGVGCLGHLVRLAAVRRR